MAGVFLAVSRIPARYPFAFGATFSCFKNGAADVLIQTQVEKCDEIDWRRASIFSTFGLLFCGCWQYVLFTKFMPKICPQAASFAAKSFRQKLKDVEGLKQLAVQVFVENGINNPLLFFPVFYSVKIGLETHNYNPIELFPKGCKRLVKFFNLNYSSVLNCVIFTFDGIALMVFEGMHSHGKRT